MSDFYTQTFSWRQSDFQTKLFFLEDSLIFRHNLYLEESLIFGHYNIILKLVWYKKNIVLFFIILEIPSKCAVQGHVQLPLNVSSVFYLEKFWILTISINPLVTLKGVLAKNKRRCNVELNSMSIATNFTWFYLLRHKKKMVKHDSYRR